MSSENQNISTHQKVARVLTLVEEASASGDLAAARPEISEFAEGIRGGLQSFYSVYQDPGLDPGLAVHGYQIMEPLMQLLQVVDDLLGGKTGPSDALAQLQELANQLVEADVALHEAEVATSLLPCYSCGHENERTATHCASCGAELQDLPKDGDYVVLPDDYWVLYNLCEAVAQGQIPIEEWRTHVNDMTAEFSNGRQKIETANNDIGAEVDADALLESIDKALNALKEMKLFEKNRNPEHLNQGWMRLLDAAKEVQDRGGQFFESVRSTAD